MKECDNVDLDYFTPAVVEVKTVNDDGSAYVTDSIRSWDIGPNCIKGEVE